MIKAYDSPTFTHRGGNKMYIDLRKTFLKKKGENMLLDAWFVKRSSLNIIALIESCIHLWFQLGNGSTSFADYY